MAPEIIPELEIDELETKLGINFSNRNLLRQALTHESFVNEWGADDVERGMQSYERLEYLGDAVLNYTVANALFERSMTATEGEMSIGRAHIVCRDSLAQAAQRLNLGDHVLRGKGETAYSPNVRDSVLEDSFEAIIGAIHEDQGYEAASQFVFRHLGKQIEQVAAHGVDKDPKSAFQELVQGIGLRAPRYWTGNAGTGADGQQQYVARVSVGGEVVASGFGNSKSKAQKSAAANAQSIFADGMPEKFAKTAMKPQTVAAEGGQTSISSSGDGRSGSTFDGFKRIGNLLSNIVLRRNNSSPGRQLIYKRPE
ncbi:MAG: ribonuclease III [Chloroflexi bacterium]|nr:ribonuclease III [Chloroflexota bacterium]MYK61613.1 ribonuclease III [Chloroflexota bacterium]